MRKLKLFLILLFSGLLAACGESSDSDMAASDGGEKIDYWVAPMDPSYKRDKPGKSPMGMDLIPVYEETGDGDGDDADAVRISPAMVQSLGVRTALVERGRLGKLIDTVGYVAFDEALISHIHLRVEGWIEKLYVTNEGERVKKGDPLFALYSPQLVYAQEEYLEALRSKNQRLIRSSRDRLASLDIPSSQIDQLKKTRKVRQNVIFKAQQDGIITSLHAPMGMFVKPETRIMSLVDLSTVWVQVEVFERQVNWVKVGQPVEMNLSFLPGRTWEGNVVYVYPELDKKTRTLRVRLEFDNPDENLKPNMYANVKLYTGMKENILFVPSEAVINSGRMKRVIIAREGGKFTAHEVTTGIESGDYTEILAGLDEGDKVVVSGQFLIDSEASLKGSITRLSDGE